MPVERDKRGGKAATTLEPAFKHSIEWNNPNKTQRGQHSSFQRIRKYGMVTAHPEVLKNMMEGINVSPGVRSLGGGTGGRTHGTCFRQLVFTPL